MSDFINLDDISLVQVDYLPYADIECCQCSYTGRIIIENTNWTSYVNTRNKQGIKFDIICPDAIRFLYENIECILCPSCDEVGLSFPRYSRYEAKNILKSLQGK